MGTIKILSDESGIYNAGAVIGIMDFIQRFLNSSNDKSFNGYIVCIPMKYAVVRIAEKLGITYKFV